MMVIGIHDFIDFEFLQYIAGHSRGGGRREVSYPGPLVF